MPTVHAAASRLWLPRWRATASPSAEGQTSVVRAGSTQSVARLCRGLARAQGGARGGQGDQAVPFHLLAVADWSRDGNRRDLASCARFAGRWAMRPPASLTTMMIEGPRVTAGEASTPMAGDGLIIALDLRGGRARAGYFRKSLSPGGSAL
jgi:hypothetical protein